MSTTVATTSISRAHRHCYASAHFAYTIVCNWGNDIADIGRRDCSCSAACVPVHVCMCARAYASAPTILLSCAPTTFYEWFTEWAHFCNVRRYRTACFHVCEPRSIREVDAPWKCEQQRQNARRIRINKMIIFVLIVSGWSCHCLFGFDLNILTWHEFEFPFPFCAFRSHYAILPCDAIAMR